MKKILPAISTTEVEKIFDCRGQIFNTSFDQNVLTDNHYDDEYSIADILVCTPEDGCVIRIQKCPNGKTHKKINIRDIKQYLALVELEYNEKSSYLIYRSVSERTCFVFERDGDYDSFLHIFKKGKTDPWLESIGELYEGVRTYSVDGFKTY